jgi:hypothetical protein
VLARAQSHIYVLTCVVHAVLCCGVLCCAVLRLLTDRSVPNLSYKEVQKVVVDSRCSSYAVQGDDEVGAFQQH